MKIKNGLIKGGNAALDLLFPENFKCIFCGVDIPDFDNQPYCKDCAKKDIFNNGKTCRICDNPIVGDGEICDICKTHKYSFQKAFCPFKYNDSVRSAILKFKDDNAKYLAKPFAKAIATRIGQNSVTIDVIIPVPSHPKTIKRRGYNQAQVLAEELGKILNVPVDPIVQKTVYTKQQKGLNYQQRQQNLGKTFVCNDKKAVAGKNILIVDDVLTTCATVNTIARMLQKEANNIYVATIARRDILDSKSYKKS